MDRNAEHQFIETDATTLKAQLVAKYEALTGNSLRPASPDNLLISWVTSIILQERANDNYIGNQNLPSRAEGDSLDALADLYYLTERPEATAATCTIRFHISEAQRVAILVPSGTRVTDMSAELYWETIKDSYIPAGDTYVDVVAQCQTPGNSGNGYELGQINTLVDVFDYYDACENITVSANGSDEATDDEFFELMRESQDAYSTAGPYGAYVYHARRVSTNIADVIPVSPSPCVVKLYVLMDDGTIAGEETKQAVYAACSADSVRPLTDNVLVEDPGTVDYNIDVTYYMSLTSSIPASDIQNAVEEAVQQFVSWQSGKLGRDINPSYLIQLLMATGIKRVNVVSPAFQVLQDGTSGTVPQVAKIGTILVTNGGYEYE